MVIIYVISTNLADIEFSKFYKMMDEGTNYVVYAPINDTTLGDIKLFQSFLYTNFENYENYEKNMPN